MAPCGRAVACYEQSRISRDVKDFCEFMEVCEQHGVLVFQVLGGLIRTDDEWSWGMRAFAASMQRKTTKKSVLAGMRRLKEQGRVLGRIPVGYKRVDKVLVVDKRWASKVRKIFELHATGRFSFETLSRHLNDDLKMAAPYRKWKTKDGKEDGDNRWHVDGLKNVMQSPTYIGRTHVGRKRHQQVEQRDAAHEPIIPPELWHQCEETRKAKKRNKQISRRKDDVESRPVAHALSGMVTCARCGGALHHQPGKREDQHWYRCGNSYRGKTCAQKTWHSAPELENMVRMALAHVASPDNADPASVKRRTTSMPKTVDPKQVLREKLKKLDERESNISRQHELGMLDEKHLRERSWAINEERVKARTEAQNAPKVDVAAGQGRLVSMIAEWDVAAKAGKGLAGGPPQSAGPRGPRSGGGRPRPRPGDHAYGVPQASLGRSVSDGPLSKAAGAHGQG